MKTKKKIIKAWAVVWKDDAEIAWHAGRPMIYGTKSEARFNAYEECEVVKILITYPIK